VQYPFTATSATIRGIVHVSGITGNDLTVESGGSLRQYAYPGSVTLQEQTVNVRNGGAIDVSGLGYGHAESYPNETWTNDSNNGGSHIGKSGVWNGTQASTYGSIYRPQENGGGGNNVRGGGALRLTASSVNVDGMIAANGFDQNGGAGAAGSIWITTGKITGAGTIVANGGRSLNCCNYGGGGGGAIALEYTDPSSVVPVLKASATSSNRQAGPGAVYVKNPASVYGDVTMDNNGISGNVSPLPSLGTGNAIAGTSGATVLTDRASNIQPYFFGHWVDIFTSGGTRKGTWRIASLSGKNFTLAPNGTETIDVVPGDRWRGVYLFDKMTLRFAKIVLTDDIRSARDLDSNSSLTINDPPALNAGLVALQSTSIGDAVVGAVTDLNTPIILTATNKRTGATFTANAGADGSFSVPVAGEVGDTFTLRATDSSALPASTAAIDVSGAIVNVNSVAQVTLQSSTVSGGTTVTGSVRLLYPAIRASAGVVTLSSSGAAAAVPATTNVPVGATSAAFQVTTTTVAADTNVVITASSGGVVKTATLTVLAANALASIVVDPATLEGGGTANGTVSLGTAAPASGATVALSSSDTSLATVPPSVVVPSGALNATFSILTSKIGAAATATINAVYGEAKSASLDLTQCAAIGTVSQPSSAPLTTVWIDDTLPAGATATTAFTNTQAASGTQSVPLSGAATWTVSGISFPAAPADNLVLYALVDPCNPPRGIQVTWNDGTTDYRATWGEDRVDALLAHTRVSGVPSGGVWVRLEVLASRLFTAAKTIKSLTVKIDGGALWIDRIGTATCSLLANVTRPASFAPNDSVFVDDQTPAGVIVRNDTNNSAVWNWDTNQSASGTSSHVEPVAGGFHQHYYYNDPNPVTVEAGDVLYAYVLVDPCNPPREIMLQWNDGSGWEHRATWGEDLIGGTRYRVGPVPEPGQWVRLEVPASAVGLNDRKIYGAAFTLYDGRTWFDRSGKVGRVNLAYRKAARQLTNYTVDYPASGAVDGIVSPAAGSMSITTNQPEQWWEVDLGAIVPMIDTIEIRGRTDCCTSQTSDVTVFVSDSPITVTTLTAARALAGVGIYRNPGTIGSTYVMSIGRSGRYVRLWRGSGDYLSLPEVYVWAPASAARLNLAAGKAAYSPAAHIYQQYYPEHAVNGSAADSYNTAGGIFHSTGVTETYWQVDLGKSQPISSIDVSARTDCCPEQLTGYYVLASDQPFTSDSLATYLADSHVAVWWVGNFVPVANIPVNRSARYVRLQKPGTGALVFTEVSVWSQQANTKFLSVPARRAD
jgi:hypothetical protein